jgi:aspartyl-tRNA(Asn)/glutamyl-tRNA(Gln) amidotransferase subunit A
VIKGHDPHDPTSISISIRSRIEDRVQRRPKREALRIGVPREYNVQELDPLIRQVWLDSLVRLQKKGHTIKKISLPTTQPALSAYYVLAPAEASSNLAKYDGVRYGNKTSDQQGSDDVLFARRRGDGLGPEVKRRILLGSYSLSADAMDNYFVKAQKIRRLVQQDFNNVFALTHPLLESTKGVMKEGVDIIVSPTALSFPPKLSLLSHNASIKTYSDDILTVPASLAGLPAISVPVPCPGKLDGVGRTGLQIIAQYGDDDLIFEAARMLE